jgi:hypothetical protein
LKRRKLLQHVAKHGCSMKEGAKHTRVFNPANRHWSTVPRHPEIDPLLIREICKQLVIPIPEEK